MNEPSGETARPPSRFSRLSLSGRIAVLFAIAGALALGGLAVLGIPGALWMQLSAPVVAMITDRRLPADGGWPMAILVTLLWPFALPLAYLATRPWRPGSPGRSQRGRWLVVTTLTVLAALLIAGGLQMAHGRA